jgi:hypothetical protein
MTCLKCQHQTCKKFGYFGKRRIHSSLRITPAMEAGLTDHAWSIAELLAFQRRWQPL